MPKLYSMPMALAALLLALGMLLVAIGQWLTMAFAINSSTESHRVDVVSTDSVAQVQLKPISHWQLFGQRRISELNAGDLPHTMLSLKLIGVIMSSLPTQSSAIIAVAEGKEEVYMHGDTIPGGATLEAIYADQVILQREHHRERLSLPDENLSLG